MSSGSTSSGTGSNDTPPTHLNYRHWLKASISAILLETGFSSVESGLIMDILCEMLQSLLYELGRSSRAFGDLACRSEPLAADVILSASEMGISLEGLREYALRSSRKTLGTPSLAAPPKPPSILHTGDRGKRVKTHFIPDYFPELPDSHSFIRTPTHKQPVTDYKSVREKASSQKRDVERALTRFIAKTGKTHSLFKTDDTNLYPLISCDRPLVTDGPDLPSYLNAILFKDQIFEEDEREFLPKKRKTDEEEEEERAEGEDEEKEDSKESESNDEDEAKDEKRRPKEEEDSSKKEARSPKDKHESEPITNPYARILKASRMSTNPKYKKTPL